MPESLAADRDSVPRLSSSLGRLGRALSAVALFCLLSGAALTPEQNSWYRARLRLPGGTMVQPQPPADSLAEAVVNWDRLRQSDNLPFYDYAAFLGSHPGWPGEMSYRRAAERTLKPDLVPPAQLVAFFKRFPPLSNSATLRYAEALLATGQPDDARRQARIAWAGGSLAPDDEVRLLSRFGAALTLDDHDSRMDELLWTGATSAATRQLQFTSPQRRPLYAARLALRTRAPDAAVQLAQTWPRYPRDAGLIADRALWMRDNADSLGARRLLADADVPFGSAHDPLEWLKINLQFAQAAANDRQWDLAYRIAAQVHAFPLGRSIRDRSLPERDVYTSLEWLAGWTAYKYLGRPGDAIAHFRNYSAAAQTPQTQSKGNYWAGRAAEAAAQKDVARRALEEAASHPDHFYGQLASERLGRPIQISPAPMPTPDAAARARFEAREPVRAARLLASLGDRAREGVFLRFLALDVATPVEQVLVAELGRSLNRPDVGVQVARESRKTNGIGLLDAGYPRLPLSSIGPSSWTMVHAISRQESQFNRDAISPAGARGLMQLMPATAREVATRLGLGYEPERLLTDSDYNVRLGADYYQRMRDYFAGSYVLSVAAYNAGPGNVNKWLRTNGDPRQPGVDVIEWIEAIPLFETRNYVQRVLENAVVYDLLNPSRAVMQGRNRLSSYLGKTQPG